MDSPTTIRIPLDSPSVEALRGVIEEFVMRDGMDMSDTEAKIEQVRRQLDHGEAELWFDEATELCNIVLVQE